MTPNFPHPQGTQIEFDQSVFRHIFRYSNGIPRLVNIACNKVFSTAYSFSQKRITGDIAKAAIRELSGKTDGKGGRIKHH
jgi:Holliday junction resolvasome RuvABC ATP-dependent DNA helicase subunit